MAGVGNKCIAKSTIINNTVAFTLAANLPLHCDKQWLNLEKKKLSYMDLFRIFFFSNLVA